MRTDEAMSERGWGLAAVPAGWTDRLVALALAATYVLVLLGTVDPLGYARDEGFYFDAARSYQAWLELWWRDSPAALRAVDHYWSVNHEHPALVKSLMALSHLFGWERWRLFALEGTSYRFPSMALAGLAVGLCYLWGARARGRLVGLVAAGSLAFVPRFFFHAHLACFDVPIVTTWTLCAYCYWRLLVVGGAVRLLGCAVAFGLALDTKHNSWFLPVVCALHAIGVSVASRSRPDERRRLVGRALSALGAMAVIGPLLLYALWPWLWRDPLGRLQAYAEFHLHHVYYNMELFGRNYFEPPMPRAYAPVMTVATVPVVTLLGFAIGVAASWRERRRHDGRVALFWALAMAVQYAAWLRPTTPIFGGTKHWLAAYPFLALFCGCGVAAAVSHVRRHWSARPLRPLVRARLCEIGFAGLAVGVPALQASHAHPWGLSQYNVAVGGAAGGATLGLNRGFWGYTTGAVAGYLDRAAPRGARVFVHDTAAPSWEMLLRDGRVRGDLRGSLDLAGSDLALYHHELHMAGVEQQIWVAYETAAPSHVAGLDGVPVIWVYRRPGLRPR